MENSKRKYFGEVLGRSDQYSGFYCMGRSGLPCRRRVPPSCSLVQNCWHESYGISLAFPVRYFPFEKCAQVIFRRVDSRESRWMSSLAGPERCLQPSYFFASKSSTYFISSVYCELCIRSEFWALRRTENVSCNLQEKAPCASASSPTRLSEHSLSCFTSPPKSQVIMTQPRCLACPLRPPG